MKFIGLKRLSKLLSFFALSALIIAAVFLIGMRGEKGSPMSEAIEGGESTLDAIGRSYQSLDNFVKDKEELAREVLKTAQASQEYAQVKLISASRTDDDFLLEMIRNYWILLNSSHVMKQGVDNLLAISNDLDEVLNHYRLAAYEEAAQKASICFQTLTPLVSQFELLNQSVDGIDYFYLASGQKERVKNAVIQYKDEMKTYLSYISLLESIVHGVNYLNAMNDVNKLFDELQHAIASGENENAQQILQQLSEQLQLLSNPEYQNATSAASELDPNQLGGPAFTTAEDLKNQLRDSQEIQEFENYLQSLSKYIEALNYIRGNQSDAAQQSIGQGLLLLGQGESISDTYLQNLYTGLENAFNSLELQIRGQPEQG